MRRSHGVSTWYSRSFVFLVLALALSISFESAFPAPKYGAGVQILLREHGFLKKAQAPDFWALISHYVPQQDGRSCSLASFTMALNALESHQNPRSAEDRLLTQKTFLDLVGDLPPIRRFFTGLVPGKTISLEEFGQIGTAALLRRGKKGYRAEVILAEGKDWKDRVVKALRANERSDRDLILANYLQSVLTGDPEGKVGHVAPVGAFDEKAGRVLILDPDREYYEPYWVSLDAFLKGLETPDADSGKNRGILWMHP